LKQRKIFSKEFKARVALDAIKGQKTINELSTEYGGSSQPDRAVEKDIVKRVSGTVCPG
jgi:transposase-like protein